MRMVQFSSCAAIGVVAIVTILCLIGVAALAAPDTTEVYEYVLSWGGYGTEPGQFKGPNGMGSDQYGNIYVCDTRNYRVQKFDSLGNFLMMFGEFGREPGQFRWPKDVAVDEDGYIYVCDYDSEDSDPSWIQKFDSLGNFTLRWGGQPGLEPGQLYKPLGVAIGDSGYVFVADQGHRIQRFTPDGEFDLFWTHPDTVHGGDVVGTYPGSVYTEWASGGDYLFRHDPAGNIILSFAGGGEVGYPHDLATDSQGNLFVADWWNTRVAKFDSLGNLITMWGGQWVMVVGIAVDLYDCVFVSCWGQDRVFKYRRTVVEVRDDASNRLDVTPGIRLAQNYPNPFDAQTVITYAVCDRGAGASTERGQRAIGVRLEVYNLLGQHVCTLVDEEQLPGEHSVIWDGRSDDGRKVANGVYLYQLGVCDLVVERHCVLVR